MHPLNPTSWRTTGRAFLRRAGTTTAWKTIGASRQITTAALADRTAGHVPTGGVEVTS